MKKLFLLILFLLGFVQSYSQPKVIYRGKVMYTVTHICQRTRAKNGEWGAPYNCKNTNQDLIIKDSRLQMLGDTGKALSVDFDGPINSFDDIVLFNTYKDRAMLKAKDQEGKECYLFYVNGTQDFYLVLDYDDTATILYLTNARPMK
jgi:hypothetical protein